MEVIVFGSDGLFGWPTSLHMSSRGHEVAIVDNASRCDIDYELECESLMPIRPMGERQRACNDVSDREIEFHRVSLWWKIRAKIIQRNQSLRLLRRAKETKCITSWTAWLRACTIACKS